jgi:5-methylcytosine-specific restriction protein A
MPNHPKTHKISKLKVKIIDDRPSSSQRGYDSSWRETRRYHLLHNPLCIDCIKENTYSPATEVHHIIKLRDRPDLRDDASNLMSLCKHHHSVRTARGE